MNIQMCIYQKADLSILHSLEDYDMVRNTQHALYTRVYTHINACKHACLLSAGILSLLTACMRNNHESGKIHERTSSAVCL